MAEHSKGRQLADAAFKKAQKSGFASSKSEALQAYEASAEAGRQNAARLKELRLAREAEEREAAAAPRKPKRDKS